MDSWNRAGALATAFMATMASSFRKSDGAQNKGMQ